MTIRIVLADDNFLVREGVRRMLQTDPELDVVDVCANLGDLLAAIEGKRPDVVLTDIRMPPDRNTEGLQAAEHCRRHYPEIGVVLLSQFIEPTYLRLLLMQGTEGRGYLLKERVTELDDLVLALREVAKGGSVIDPKVVESLVQVRSKGGGDMDRLTPRERDVLAAMAQGKNNAAVAAELVLSVRAVEKHINSIFSKLGFTGEQTSHPRVSAVLMYLADGKV